MTEQTLNEFLLARIDEDTTEAGRAECTAMRRIVDLHPARWIYVEANRKMGEEQPQVECVGGPVYDDEVRILGEVYAAHEDYREEWHWVDTSGPFDLGMKSRVV